MAAAQKPNAAGFAWCNETRNVVMAAFGLEDQGNVVTRGWYRVAPGKCLRPDVTGKPRRLYSFGEAIGADGLPLAEAGKAPGQNVSWGGSTILCTRNVKFVYHAASATLKTAQCPINGSSGMKSMKSRT